MKNLTQKRCLPCEGGVSKLTSSEIQEFLKQISAWCLEGEKIHKTFQFKNFLEAMKFVNQMAEIAEQEGHHPDFSVHYNKVDIFIWTHAIGGLSENDFILAAKIDQITH